jgi:thioredoxin-like negative regulator of GroEL
MQRLLGLAFAALLVPAAGAAAVTWETSLERGSATALKASKLLFIEFWASWCPPCLVMDAEVYPNASVIEAMTKVVPVRIDVDKQPQVARQYRLTGMPTIVFADSYGNELFRFMGTLTVDTALKLIKDLPGDVTTFNRLSEVLAKDKDNFAALTQFGGELRTAGLWRPSNAYFSRAMRVRARRDQRGTRGAILIAMGHNHLELKEFAEAADVFERFLKEFAGSPAEAEAMLGLGRALLAQNRRSEARRTLERLTARYRSGPAYEEAVRLLDRAGGAR